MIDPGVAFGRMPPGHLIEQQHCHAGIPVFGQHQHALHRQALGLAAHVGQQAQVIPRVAQAIGMDQASH